MNDLMLNGSKIHTAGDFEIEIRNYFPEPTQDEIEAEKRNGVMHFDVPPLAEYSHFEGNLDSIEDYCNELLDYYPKGTKIIWRDHKVSKEYLKKTDKNKFIEREHGVELFDMLVKFMTDQGFDVVLD